MAAPAKRPKIDKVDTPRTKADVIRTISDNTGLTRSQVTGVFDTLGEVIAKDIGKSGPGQFNVPGLMKITVQRKPATKARKGINPFTKQETIFAAKPARNVVKVRPLKSLKDMV